MNNTYILISIATMSLITIVLRFIPFLFLNDIKDYQTLNYLSNLLPCAIMAMLVVYCLRDINFSATRNYVPALISTFVVSISYIIKRNTLLSILLGTIIYMFLLQVVF